MRTLLGSSSELLDLLARAAAEVVMDWIRKDEDDNNDRTCLVTLGFSRARLRDAATVKAIVDALKAGLQGQEC